MTFYSFNELFEFEKIPIRHKKHIYVKKVKFEEKRLYTRGTLKGLCLIRVVTDFLVENDTLFTFTKIG